MRAKRKTTGLIIFLSCVLVILGAVGALALWQKENIQALIYSTRYTSEERERIVSDQETAVLSKIAEEIPEAQVTPLSEEEEQMLQNGEISREEAMELMMDVPAVKMYQKVHQQELLPNPVTLKQKSLAAMQAASREQAPSASDNVQDSSALQSLIAQVYVMRASYTGQINSLVAQAKQEYIQAKGTASVGSIAGRYIGKAAALEGQCDGEMSALLSQIRSELTRLGRDTGLADEIYAAYQSEKSAKKAAILESYY